MNKNLISILTSFLLVSCTYRPKQDKLIRFRGNDKKVIRSFYKIEGDIINYTRLLTKENDLYINHGKIFNNEQ